MIWWQAAADFRSYLATAGLDSFQALMTAPVGELLDRDKGGRELRRITIPVHGGSQQLFLRRIGREPLGVLLRMLLFGRIPRCGPLREKMMIDALTAASLPVMGALAWGEERRFGLPVRGFLLVEGVQGTDLGHLFATLAPTDRRRELSESFGAFVARLHGAGFFQPVRLKDVFCVSRPDGYGFTLIDRETSKPWPVRFSRRRSVNALARAYRRTIRDGHPLSRRDIQAFIRGFLNGLPPASFSSPKSFRRLISRAVQREIKTSN
ncbi:MAG: lipopolysaccharide kinase InaA family protein [Trichloromonas sp.]|nr:lipopolysaccharide kinase InaA family protein [Trichloromonas sp.]